MLRGSRTVPEIAENYPFSERAVFDKRGFADWRDVVDLLQERFDDVTEDDIRAVVTDSKKQRFELQDDRVRATYGQHDRYGPQIDVVALRDVTEEDRADGFDPAEFVEHSRFDREKMFVELRGLAEASSVSSNVLPSFLIPASSADVATRTKAGTCVAPA